MSFKRTFAELRVAIESKWASTPINPNVYGFQIQRGTRWNPGLSEEDVERYEHELDVTFSPEFRALLNVMNGTDRGTLNVYGSSGLPTKEGSGVYAYPRDLNIVKERLRQVQKKREVLARTLLEQGEELSADAGLVPIFAHRYAVCEGRRDCASVLSIADEQDVILYADSLADYLRREFLGAQ